MADANLFTMLSAYRPGSPATPFENYCTAGLAYFLKRGQRMLTALVSDAAGVREPLAVVEVQPRLGETSIPDLMLTFEGGQRVIVEVQVEGDSVTAQLPALEEASTEWDAQPGLVLLGLDREATPAPWQGLSWLQVVEALEDDTDPLAREYSEFILRDILGLGSVPLDEAVTTNRLYALGAGAVRRKFSNRVRYVNSASRPVGARYRYLGTTFALEGGEMEYWIGIVNETVPLGDHYHLMLASRERPVREAVPQPRATGDWKWAHWTGVGRVVRAITPEQYDDLLSRLK